MIVEVALLDFPPLIVSAVSVDVKQHWAVTLFSVKESLAMEQLLPQGHAKASVMSVCRVSTSAVQPVLLAETEVFPGIFLKRWV